jgi:hypothetical protein
MNSTALVFTLEIMCFLWDRKWNHNIIYKKYVLKNWKSRVVKFFDVINIRKYATHFYFFFFPCLWMWSRTRRPLNVHIYLYFNPVKTVQVQVTLRLTVIQSVNLGGELGAHAQIFITVERHGFVVCGAPSLTRGWACLLYKLLALASAVFLASESLVTHDRILLSQIWDFPFRRLLRLPGSRWRYSTQPPHGYVKTVFLLNNI